MRRVIAGVLLGAVLALPISFGVVQASQQDVVTESVAASDCPAAVAAREAAGLPQVDRFMPDCPDPSTIQAPPPRPPEDILVIDEACGEYLEDFGRQPSWCPSEAEVSSARKTVSK